MEANFFRNIEADLYKNMIAYELGEVAKASRHPRRPPDDLPPIVYRARPASEPAVAASEPDRAGWLIRFSQRLAATATMWSL